MTPEATRADDTPPPDADGTYVGKACVYVTRGTDELLVFEGPGHDEYQIPKGTIEPGERPREAAFREVAEESGLGSVASFQGLASDLWCRRPSDDRWYERHFFHASVHGARDHWVHTVDDGGPESGSEFRFGWVPIDTLPPLALDLDEYVFMLV
jgi:8-oxo-dGTP pyrophosphatase MutT (NUDIX family)